MADIVRTPPSPAPAPATQASGKDAFIEGVRGLLTLQIVTVVGEATVTGELAKPDVRLGLDTTHAIATAINVATGDITNVVPEQFWAPDKKNVLDFHLQQVNDSTAIVRNNLQLLAEFGEKLAKTLKKLETP